MLLHLRETALREVLEGLDAIVELTFAQSSVSVEVHASNNGNEQSVTGVNAALDEEALQVGSVDEAEVAVIDYFVARLQVVVVTSHQVLLQHLCLPRKSQFFLEQLCQTSFHVVGKELIGCHRVGRSL